VWFKVDDQLAFHRKTLKAGNSAMGLWVRAGSWLSGQKRTDAPGVITVTELRTMGTAAEIRRLLDAEFLEACKYQGEKACRFNDWLEYQPEAPELAAKREEWATRKRRSRKHRAGDHTECLPGHCDALEPPEEPDGWPGHA
jgi:hypothetical protein